MPKFIYKKHLLPEQGKHLCTLTGVLEVENRFYDPDEHPKDRELQFEWAFAYDEKPEIRIRVWSSRKISSYRGKKSKALAIAEALLGKALDEGEKAELATEALVGRKCYLEVGHLRDENGQLYAKVKDFERASELPF